MELGKRWLFSIGNEWGQNSAPRESFAKTDFIFGWAPYTSYSNIMSIMLYNEGFLGPSNFAKGP